MDDSETTEDLGVVITEIPPDWDEHDLSLPPVPSTRHPDPMRKLFSPESVNVDALRVICGERLQVLHDTFGPEDHRVRHAERRMNEYIDTIAEPGAAWTFAAAYLNWATKYPGDIIEDHGTQTCSCPGGSGWVEEEGQYNTIRPCLRCNRGAYEQMVARANGIVRPVSQEPDPFTDD